MTPEPGSLKGLKPRKVARVAMVYLADLPVLLPASGLTTRSELGLDPICDPLRDRADFQALSNGEG